MNSVAESPKRFWGVLREMRGNGGGNDIPGKMKESMGDDLCDNEKEINAMWIRAYHRKKYKCKTASGQKWHNKLKKFVVNKEHGVRKAEGKEQHNVKIGIKAFLKAVGPMKKDGSPGNDLITARLLNEADMCLKVTIADMMEKWTNTGILPDHFRTEIVVPLFKRMCRYTPKCYRPVSLVQVGLKAMKSVLYAEVNEKYGK